MPTSPRITAVAVCSISLAVGLGAGAVMASGDSSGGELKSTETRLERLPVPAVKRTAVPALKLPKRSAGSDTSPSQPADPTPSGDTSPPPPAAPPPPPPPPPPPADQPEDIF